MRAAEDRGGTVEAMQDPISAPDPWSTKGLPFTRAWPLYAGVAAGAAFGVLWLLLDRPPVSFLAILVLAGAIAGAIAAAVAPSNERSARFLDIAYPIMLAGVASEFFGAIGLIVTGNDQGGQAINETYVYFFVMVFFVGFPLLIAKVFQSPKRRLPDSVLAQIGDPYPTRRSPRVVTVRAEDGTTHRVSVLRGGFLAGVGLRFDPTTVTGVVGDHVVPTGPKQVKAARAAVRDDAETKLVAKRRAKADAKATKAGGHTGEATTDRPTPAPTSRTTPKGTVSRRKASKK
jgi:hypothetical protein